MVDRSGVSSLRIRSHAGTRTLGRGLHDCRDSGTLTPFLFFKRPSEATRSFTQYTYCVRTVLSWGAVAKDTRGE